MRFSKILSLCVLGVMLVSPALAGEARHPRGQGRAHDRHDGRTGRWHADGRHYHHGYRHVYRRPSHWRGGLYSHWDYGYWPVYSRARYSYGYPSYGVAVYDDDFSYARTGSGSRAANGFWLGALTGAIIGHNSGDLGHNAWRGAAIGAVGGLAIGAIADHRARQREARESAEAAPVYAAPSANAPTAAAITETPAPAATPVQSATPMASANRLFGR